ncbi:MAG: Rib/alpha-like domain-containing protein, partial [Gemella haemolysans]|uniref:Rib/alpha-like domain-containing protein n=1 Tax=Gemella haemolysans TaxID=1379 RepID=UPI002908821B
MLFNRQGVQQKNWRMVKKGKQILFGCSLFFVVGGMSISSSQVTYASDANSSEVIAKQEKNNNLGEQNSTVVIPALEKQAQSSNKKLEKTTVSEDNKKFTEKKEVKEVNKKELKDLVDKIKETDISKKTEKSVKELNLILSRVEKTLDNKEITQEEIDKEIRELKEAFDKLEDKPKEDKKSEVKEKDESKKDNKVSSEKDNKEKQEQNSTEDVARKHNEKITKVTETVNEIHSIANQINYEFSESEKELVKTAEKLPTAYNSDKYNEEAIQKLLKEVIYLRNKVANRMTRAHSGKRDPRNGQPINGNGESRFRAVYFLPTQNQHGRGEAGLVTEARTDLTYYNSDEIYSFMRVLGQRGPGEPLYKYEYGENRGKEDGTPYYLKTVGVISGLDKLKGITLRVAYKNPRTGKEDFQDITSGAWPVNNPEVKAVIRGWLGRYDKTGEAVEPGDYRVTIAAGRQRPENSITYTFHIKAQSERNTVNDLATPTYVDDVRHLTETEKTALIKKFEAAHPGVVNRPVHVDYDHAEVSADGATMTIHFKDGFAPKTIQTNAQNDAVAKYQNLTALYGDPHDFYKNPRNLVKSITGNELPSTVDVQWKTPFNLQQPGTRNAVVTVTYQNGTVKDVSTPYTVLDFVGKQDKRINQYQSGELGDARSYITLSNGTAPATDLTIRWKGGSTVDTSRPTIHRKQIEILRGNTVMKTVDIPVEIVDNIRPTVEIPYDNPGNQEVYLYSHENNNITLKAKDNNGKISKVYLAFPADNRQGLGQEDTSYLGGGSSDGLYLTATKIKSETTGSNTQPATITVSGNINNQPFTGEKSITRYLYTEDPAGNANYEHVGHANDKGAAGRIRFVWKPQTFKYTATPNAQKQTVSYGATPDAGTSINKTGLPVGTTYTWATTPSTTTGPGEKAGVVTVTYPDGSTDTVNVTVNVRRLADEYAPTGNKIVRNQNTPVTNDDLKAAVSINNNGKIKVKSVTPVGIISTTNSGTSTIKATVTYLDDTTDPVDIPLEVKDVTKPTIQSPTDRQNWNLIALDRTLPEIKVTSTDNPGGSGIKSTTVTGLPDFLVFDNTTKTIKFKNGVQEVTKLPVGQDSKTYTVSIQVTDNANNPSQRQFTITVKSMTTKYNATPNAQKQTVSYGATPDVGTSINKNGLPAGTTYTWATTPSTTTGPGEKAGVVTVTYPDGSKDTVNVTVNVRELNGEYKPTATKITKNQNESVSNDELKAAVTINNNGNSKVKSVTPVGTISTTNAGTTTIKATVTYLDNTTDPVDIPLEVKDVTAPTIQSPSDRQNWDLIALDRTLPSITVTSVDNNGGTGVKSTTVTGLPDYLVYDNATKTIKFKNGVQEVTKLPVGQDSKTYTVSIQVTDNADNPSQRQFTITVKSMTTKYDATANSEKQTVSYGEAPDAGTSVNKTNLPAGTTYTWATTPSTTTGPGDKAGVVTVTYPDGSKDTVNVTVNVRALNDEYKLAATEIEVNQNDQVSNDRLKTVVSATSKVGGVNGIDKISTVTAPTINTANYGSQNITATVTFKDGTVKEVTIPLKVKDVTDPTIQSPAEKTNWEMTALDKTLPPMEVRAEDNANGSGIKSISVTGLPDYLEYDKTINSIKFKAGRQEVEKLPVNTPSKEFTLTIRVEDNAGNISERKAKITVYSMSKKNNPTPLPQEVDNGHVPNAEESVNKTGLPEGTTVTWKTTPD